MAHLLQVSSGTRSGFQRVKWGLAPWEMRDFLVFGKVSGKEGFPSTTRHRVERRRKSPFIQLTSRLVNSPDILRECKVSFFDPSVI